MNLPRIIMSACSENQVDTIESNDEDGDGLYQDQKVNYYLREKKYIYIYTRITSWKWYRLLSPVLKSDMVTCTPVKQKLK